MGASPLFPFIVALFMFGVIAIGKSFVNSLPATQNIAAAKLSSEAEAFLSYKDAVTRYMQANPSFSGAITFAELTAKGAPSNMENTAHNEVFTNGATNTGRLIVIYANVKPTAISYAYSISNEDASLGVATVANTWTSLQNQAQPYPLPTSAIQKGALVAVVQIGT